MSNQISCLPHPTSSTHVFEYNVLILFSVKVVSMTFHVRHDSVGGLKQSTCLQKRKKDSLNYFYH